MDLLTEALARMGLMIQPAAKPAKDALMAAPDHVKLLVARLGPIASSSWAKQEATPHEDEKKWAETSHFALDVGTPSLSPVEGSLSLDQPFVLVSESEAAPGRDELFRPWRWPRPCSTRHRVPNAPRQPSLGGQITSTDTRASKVQTPEETNASDYRGRTPEPLADKLLEFKTIFGDFAKGFGGAVTTKELGLLLNLVGQHPPKAVLQDMIIEADAYWCGNIDFAVFMCISNRHLGAIHHTPEFSEAFPVHEVDIKVNEFGRLVRIMGQDLTDEDLQDMFAEIDFDGTGSIHGVEFCEIVSEHANDSAMQIAMANEIASSSSAL